MAAGTSRRHAQLGQVAELLRGPTFGYSGGVQAQARVRQWLQHAEGGGDLVLVEEVDDAVKLLSCRHDRKYLTMSTPNTNQTRQDQKNWSNGDIPYMAAWWRRVSVGGRRVSA
jgi:hypothetical protein